jgi:hypothetical protein
MGAKRRGNRKTAVHVQVFLLIVVLTGCLPTTPLPTPPTNTPTLTSTATPTIIWFPPTPTHTPIPYILPSTTPEFRSGIGDIILQDDFTASDHWLTGKTGKGTISIELNEISLAITQPNGYLFTIRDEPIMTNFYAEITASPTICTGMDEYGMLIRYNSMVDFYRFSLSCDGRTRLDKLVGGIATSPQPWLNSSSVPTAAPSSSRIGVWAQGNELRFFINDEFQFGVNDRIHPGGLIGVFGRSGGETAVTVSFKDLVVHQIMP